MQLNSFRTVVLCTVLVVPTGAVAPTWPGAPASLERYRAMLGGTIPPMMSVYGVPGVSIALLHNGRVEPTRSYGWADGDQTLRITDDTVYGVASISKLVIAWGFLKLVGEGKMRLDAPITLYLTRQQGQLLSFDASKITVRQLLSHTSGLPRQGSPVYWPGQRVLPVDRAILYKTSDGKPACAN